MCLNGTVDHGCTVPIAGAFGVQVHRGDAGSGRYSPHMRYERGESSTAEAG